MSRSLAPSLWNDVPCAELDGDGRLVRVNDHFASLLGRSAGECQGLPRNRWLHPAGELPDFAGVRAGAACHADVLASSTHGGKVLFDAALFATDSSDAPIAMIARDVTALRRGAETVRERSEAVTALVERIAAGDLGVEVVPDGPDDLVRIALKRFVTDLANTFRRVLATSDHLDQGSDQLSESGNALAQNATRSAAALQELSATMSAIATQTTENASNAESALDIANRARRDADAGDERMQQMVQSMRAIDEASRSISKIIKVIDDIAFQTNLLALNAAVEAGRAGVHGRGFAVVAEEVRRLAARSAEAAKETTEMIEGSTRTVQQGLDVARATAESLDAIVGGVGKVSDLLGDIAASSQEQASSIAEVHQALGQLDDNTQQNTAKAEELAASAADVARFSAELNQLLSHFSVPTEVAPGLPEGLSPEILQAFQRFVAEGGAV